jgi:hypothetical protein
VGHVAVGGALVPGEEESLVTVEEVGNAHRAAKGAAKLVALQRIDESRPKTSTPMERSLI